MIFDILTLLPEVCDIYCQTSIMGRAQKKGLVEVRTTNIRDFAKDKHRTVDDTPYGGGDGMVMMAEPVLDALASLPEKPCGKTIILSPQGKVFDQDMALEFAKEPRLILICGRYEGLDQRAYELSQAEEVSLGDFVLTGGELGALCLVDAVARLIPNVLGGQDSALADSFMDGLLEHPHYTRPAIYQGQSVPDILLSGNHQAIAAWRRKESLRRTLLRRPDLLEKVPLSKDDEKVLAELRLEEKK